MRTAALLISVIFHPLLMPTYGCLLLFFGITDTVYDYLTPVGIKWRLTAIVFIFSFLFPVINIYVLYKMKRIPSLTLSERQDRTFPYVMTALFYFGLFYLIMDVKIWSSLKIFIIGAGVAILLTALVNLRTKISAHMVGIGGLLGVIMSISYLTRFNMSLYFAGIIVMAGIIAMARISLNEHRPVQIYLGFFLGLAVQLILFFSLQTFIFA